jgi:WNK lysine deficient protein kinase
MEKLGSGASKDVYRAYDTTEGIEVAWNVVNLAGVPKNERNRIVNEVRLLERLHHQNIISFHGSWVNRERQEVNFVTEILSSGTLKSFIEKVQVIRWKIAKRWAVQILKGLDYLHSQEPPVIHRDLKCDNIFINGTSGDLRIGDLGLSTVHRNGKVLSVLGTPEFMAPDLYEESAYDEKVDIYAFGMCLLEIFTKEIPYRECNNTAQIYKKVLRGDLPSNLTRLKSDNARKFIMLCLGYKNKSGKYVRPSAAELLTHPFLQKSDDDDDEVEVLKPMNERAIIESPVEWESTESRASQSTIEERSTAEVVRPRSWPADHGVEEESDRFDEMPDSEVNMKRVTVLMGRGEELKEHEEEDNDKVLVQQQEQGNAISPSTVDQRPHSTGQVSGFVVTNVTEGQAHSGQLRTVDSQQQYLVAAALIEEDSPHFVPYEDDMLKLIITLPVEGQPQNVQFDFHLVQDDPVQVAREMVVELSIPQEAILEISETISGIARQARMKQDKYNISRWQNQQGQAQQSQQQGVVVPPQQHQESIQQHQSQSQPQQGLAYHQQQQPNLIIQRSDMSGNTDSTQQQLQPQQHHAVQYHQQQQQNHMVQPSDVSMIPDSSQQIQAHHPLIYHQQQQRSHSGQFFDVSLISQFQGPAQSEPDYQRNAGTTAQMSWHQPSHTQPSGVVSGTIHEDSSGSPSMQYHHQVQAVPQGSSVGLLLSASPLPPAPSYPSHTSTSTNGAVAESSLLPQVDNTQVGGSSPQYPTQVAAPVAPQTEQVKVMTQEIVQHGSQPVAPQAVVPFVHQHAVAQHNLPTAPQDLVDSVAPLTEILDEPISDQEMQISVTDEEDDEESELAEEMRRLDEDFQKNILRAQKVFDNRMDNLQRSKLEKEFQHQKTLEKHEKERIEFEKRAKLEEIEQTRRIEEMQREWDRQREELAKAKKQGSGLKKSSDPPKAPAQPGQGPPTLAAAQPLNQGHHRSLSSSLSSEYDELASSTVLLPSRLLSGSQRSKSGESTSSGEH